jgi:hypothetical protein
MGLEGTDWIILAQDRDKWRDFLIMVMETEIA